MIAFFVAVFVVLSPLFTQAFLFTTFPHLNVNNNICVPTRTPTTTTTSTTTETRRCPPTETLAAISWGFIHNKAPLRRRNCCCYKTRLWNSADSDPQVPVNFAVPPLPLEISLTDGTVVSLEVSDGNGDTRSGGDGAGGGGGGGVESCISEIVSKIGTRTQDGPESLATLLMSYWQQHVQTFREFYQPQIYNGPLAYDSDENGDNGDHQPSSSSSSLPSQTSSRSSYESSVHCRVELPSGLVLEVGRSTIPNAGLGLFIRKKKSKSKSQLPPPTSTLSDGDGILQTIGSAFAGYSNGSIVQTLEGCTTYQTSRAFEFRLDEQLRSTVWYGSKILTIDEALAESGATSVAGHYLMFEDDDDDDDGDGDGDSDDQKSQDDRNFGNTSDRRRLVWIVPDDDDRFYFVPDYPSSYDGDNNDKNNVSIQTIGHFVNDLAGGGGGDGANNVEEYDTLSDLRNILVLVPRVHAVPVVVDENGKDVKNESDVVGDTITIKQLEMAGMPLLTLSKSIVVDNTIPMEIGLKYGYNYWNP